MRRLSSFILFLALVTHAWADTHHIEFTGSQFQPDVHTIDGRTYYDTADDQVVALMDRANIARQWSSSGQTLFVFAPGRESYWTVDSDTITVNKEEVPAPGRLITKDGRHYIEPAALFYASAVYGKETGSGYQLFPVVTEIASTDSGLLLRSASKARARASKQGQTSVFTLDGFAWDGDESFVVDGSRIDVSGGADKGEPLAITITPAQFHSAKLAGSTLLNETKIDILVDFPGAEHANNVALEALNTSQDGNLEMLLMEFDQGTKIHYWKDKDNGTLHIYVPKAEFTGSTFSSSKWPGLTVAQHHNQPYSVLEITIPINEAYEFVTIDGSVNTIGLLRGTDTHIADIGSVETPGWMSYRGTIVIDPGHGGSDPGCVNHALGVREADVTLRISLHLAEILRAQGWNVVLTRETDRDVTYAGSPDRMELEARSGIANEIGADLFMSIHCDASVSSNSNGSSIHWWKSEDYAFAQSLEPVLGHAIGLGQKGLIRNRFVVLRHAQMPAVLVETAFLTNPTEGAKLSDPEFQKVVANQLAGGLANYMRGAYASRGLKAVD